MSLAFVQAHGAMSCQTVSTKLNDKSEFAKWADLGRLC